MSNMIYVPFDPRNKILILAKLICNHPVHSPQEFMKLLQKLSNSQLVSLSVLYRDDNTTIFSKKKEVCEDFLTILEGTGSILCSFNNDAEDFPISTEVADSVNKMSYFS